jgi:hypothetical protein
MPADTRNPLSIFTGQRNQIRLVTKTHGVIRPNLVDSFEFTPKLSNKRVPEFDNLVDALTYTTFDGGSGKISYLESNQGQISAALMDIDPASVTQMLNPATLADFQVFMNLMGLDGKIKGCMLLYGCTPTGNPFQQTVKEGAKRSLDFECLNGIIFPGLALQYTRARGATTQQAAPADPALATANAGGFLTGGDTVYVQLTAVTAAGETLAGNEAAIHIPTGTNTNKVTVTVPAPAGAITSYNGYVSNRSNGERFSFNTAVGGAIDVLELPSTTAARPPLQNTSGVFAAPNDKTFSGAGPWTVTLDNAAFKLPQTGLDYGLVKRDGAIVGTVDNPATIDTFLFNSAGTQFSVNEDPATHAWELFTFYQP